VVDCEVHHPGICFEIVAQNSRGRVTVCSGNFVKMKVDNPLRRSCQNHWSEGGKRRREGEETLARIRGGTIVNNATH
jgi:hypothetical protein